MAQKHANNPIPTTNQSPKTATAMSIKRNKIEQFLQWEGGQRLFNFAYSVGAAIVILGALFKILHIEGGNTLLMVGMGTEVLMFLLTAFDRPPREYNWSRVFPQLIPDNEKGQEEESPDEYSEIIEDDETADYAGNVPNRMPAAPGGYAQPVAAYGVPTEGVPSAGVAVVGGGTSALDAENAAALSQTIQRMSAAAEQLEAFANMADVTRDMMTKMAAVSDQLTRLRDTTDALNGVSSVLLDSYKTITENSADISRSATGYVKEMEALNHNVGGLNHIYEIQLRSVASQLDAIDRVNRGIKDIRDMYERSASQSTRYCEETEKMARYMQQLNHVYENMLHAMTVNMYNPMMGGVQRPADTSEDRD